MWCREGILNLLFLFLSPTYCAVSLHFSCPPCALPSPLSHLSPPPPSLLSSPLNSPSLLPLSSFSLLPSPFSPHLTSCLPLPSLSPPDDICSPLFILFSALVTILSILTIISWWVVDLVVFSENSRLDNDGCPLKNDL